MSEDGGFNAINVCLKLLIRMVAIWSRSTMRFQIFLMTDRVFEIKFDCGRIHIFFIKFQTDYLSHQRKFSADVHVYVYCSLIHFPFTFEWYRCYSISLNLIRSFEEFLFWFVGRKYLDSSASVFVKNKHKSAQENGKILIENN